MQNFRETKRRIVNKPLERNEFFGFFSVSSLFHEAECRLVLDLGDVRRTRGVEILESNKSKHP
jgi:hypothetical protein